MCFCAPAQLKRPAFRTNSDGQCLVDISSFPRPCSSNCGRLLVGHFQAPKRQSADTITGRFCLKEPCASSSCAYLSSCFATVAELSGRLPPESVEQLERQSQTAAVELVQKYMKKCAVADVSPLPRHPRFERKGFKATAPVALLTVPKAVEGINKPRDALGPTRHTMRNFQIRAFLCLAALVCS